MSGYVACEGSGQAAAGLERFPSQPDGLGATRAKTFGKCPSCGRTVMSYGLVNRIKVARHKARVPEPEPATWAERPENACAADGTTADGRSYHYSAAHNGYVFDQADTGPAGD